MSWLEEYTNRDEAYWVARVQTLVSEATVPREDGHGDTNLAWIYKLVDEIVEGLPPIENMPYDGNMRIGATVSMILGLWFSQLQYAKTQDSHRPTFVRQRAYRKRLDWVDAMLKNIFDMSKGSTYFPGQPWQDPFAPESKGGEFL